MRKLEQVEFMQSNSIGGQRHKSVNTTNPLMSHFTLELEDDWVKIRDTRKQTEIWVPTAQCAVITPMAEELPEIEPPEAPSPLPLDIAVSAKKPIKRRKGRPSKKA